MSADAPRPTEPFQYAVVRVVPRIEREEFINVGVIVFCRTRRYLEAQIALDRIRLACLDPTADADAINVQLHQMAAVAAGASAGGAIAALPQSERFHWLAAPSSTVVQSSEIHSGLCREPPATLARLFARLVDV